ncbi:MAG: T9SS type A sorting domain-containing protein [Bacteroidota bacterium]|jgi:2',3'-cyclic-nucleotide 2'-phosphodiesterase (5'-nucleotidase family)
MTRLLKYFEYLIAWGLFVFSVAFSQTDTLTIIHVNDTHGHLLPFPYATGLYGGVARAATVIERWKQTEPNAIFVHAGDFMVQNLMYNTYMGVPDLQILNSLGCDVLCLGNHEFDFGSSNLGDVLVGAGVDSSFKFICSNALNLDSIPALQSMVHPYAIKQKGGLKVGFIGLTTPAADIESNPGPVFLDTNIVQCVLQNVAVLKALNCDVIIVLSHLGLPLDITIAPYLSGVDAIIGAHTHTAMDTVMYVNNIPIVQAGAFFRYVGKLRLVHHNSVTSVLDYTLKEIRNTDPADSAIASIVDSLKRGVSQQYTPILGRDPYAPVNLKDFDTTLFHNNIPVSIDSLQTRLGKYITGWMLYHVPHADCALEPVGHMENCIYPGPVTPADLFDAYPDGFDPSDGLGFRIASYQLYGAEIVGMLQGLLGYIHPEVGDYEYAIEASGLTYSVSLDNGVLKLDTVLIGGAPVKPDSLYTVVSSDRVIGYMQNLFGLSPQNISIETMSVFQVVLSVREVRLASPTARTYKLLQNYPNPFNPTTMIRFELPKSSHVVLKVYNVLGQEVATLIDGMKPVGVYQVTWNAGGLPSGVYLYRLEAGSFSETRKLMLVK